MPIFDTHAHYDDEVFDEDRDEILASLKRSNIEKVVDIGASLSSCRRVKELADKYKFIYAAFGVHPEEVMDLKESDMDWLKLQCRHKKCVAVGEIGLDYHYDDIPKEVQKKWFERQLELAREVKKPVVIHSREAAEDTLEILKAYHAEDVGGVMHCFSYTKEIAREVLKMGFYIGIGGVITFKNVRKIKEAVAYAPIESIVLETDCPYLAPEPYRGSRNTSLNLPYIVKAVAEIKDMHPDAVIGITWRNAHKLFGLKE